MKDSKAIGERKQKLHSIVKLKRQALKKAPEGRLEIATMRGFPHFYQVTARSNDSATQKTYLNEKKAGLVKALAQKAYDQRIIKVAEQELKAWDMLAKYFPDLTVEEVFQTLSPARQKLVTPIIPSDEEYRKQWEAVTYEPGWFKEGAPVYITDRGERVRSKSEQLIANLLYRLHIPYRYEYPIGVIVNGRKRIWRPDFTILDVKHRRELYLEHFGKLDDQEEPENYARNAFGKIKIYEENGMFEGGCMIFSFETSKAPLDISYLEMKLHRLLGLSSVGNPA